MKNMHYSFADNDVLLKSVESKKKKGGKKKIMTRNELIPFNFLVPKLLFERISSGHQVNRKNGSIVCVKQISFSMICYGCRIQLKLSKPKNDMHLTMEHTRQ